MKVYKDILVGKGFPLSHDASFNLVGVGDGNDDCQCHGSGVIVSTHVLSGPYDHQPMTGKGRAAIYGKGGWYIAESETVPCPICSGDREELVHHLVSNCNIPVTDRTKNLSYYKERPGAEIMADAMAGVIEELPDVSGFITLFGPHGTGKTTAAQIVVLYACREGVNALYLTAQEIVYGIKATWGNYEKTEEDYIHSLMIPRLLVIDEMNMVPIADMPHVRAVVDARHRIVDKAMTIMITGEDLSRVGGDEYIRARMSAGMRIPVT